MGSEEDVEAPDPRLNERLREEIRGREVVGSVEVRFPGSEPWYGVHVWRLRPAIVKLNPRTRSIEAHWSGAVMVSEISRHFQNAEFSMKPASVPRKSPTTACWFLIEVFFW